MPDKIGFPARTLLGLGRVIRILTGILLLHSFEQNYYFGCRLFANIHQAGKFLNVRNAWLLPLVLWSLLGATTIPAIPPPAFLLPDDVVPTRYIVDLTIDPNQPSFEGWVRIEVELHKPVSVIWANAKDLTPAEASVETGGRTHRARAEMAGGEFIALELDAPVGPGPSVLSIRHRGRLDEAALAGPYRRQVAGDWYVFTTFTPIDARRAFPCFDEPGFKTRWDLTLHVPRDQKAFANTRVLSETEEPGGMKAVHFAPTEPLPAEVVAFAVGPFDGFEGASAGHGTPVRVITAKGHAADGKAAAQATVDVLPRLEMYTGIPYPFGKLDHIALPEGAYGAVENPGLITYLARALLVSPAEETPEKTRSIRALEAHEIAHQWFGDLVTQETWQDVWLSEGFATWLSAKVMDEEQPAARKHLNAITAREGIMTTDAGPLSRPVRLAMQSPEEMRGVYSQFVYQKGAAVLLMLEGWLGENRVQDGLRAYLKQHSFANASTADLEAALRGSAGTDPTSVMHAFLDQAGIPEIHGEVNCAEDSGPRLEIAQNDASHEWSVPVCWRTDGSQVPSCIVLDTPHREIELPKGTACPAWTYLNAGGTGYYRTQWTAAQLAAWTNRGVAQLTPAERLTLVYDLRAQKQAGRLDISALLTKLTADPEPEIAKAAREALE